MPKLLPTVAPVWTGACPRCRGAVTEVTEWRAVTYYHCLVCARDWTREALLPARLRRTA